MELPTRPFDTSSKELCECALFLLQTAQVRTHDDVDISDYYEYDDENENFYLVHWNSKLPKVLEPEGIDDFILDNGLGSIYWEVDHGGAWFTRKEAENEARSRPHHYGSRKGRDWRVYSIFAHGELKKVLTALTEDKK